MLELKNITKVYPGRKTALQDVSLTIGPGQVVGLFGENGAGKTTLMKCILGLLKHQGAVTLDGAPIGPKNITRLSYATNEHSFFPTLTAQSHREFYAAHFETFNLRQFDTLMDFFELPRAKAVGGFSTGQKNQFEVILALSQGADYILMDEPFAGNDVFNREDFYRVLLATLGENRTVILSTHLLEEVEPILSRVVLLSKGRLIGDATVEELEAKGMNLMQYVKQTYHYRDDRVGKALRELTGEGE